MEFGLFENDLLDKFERLVANSLDAFCSVLDVLNIEEARQIRERERLVYWLIKSKWIQKWQIDDIN